MRHWVWAVLALMALPHSVQAANKEQDAAQLAPTHGFVYASFSKGGAYHLTVQPEQGGKEEVIQALINAEPLPNAQAIGKWLPAGRYKLTRWAQGEWADEQATFEVQAGRITTLGNFVAINVGGHQLALLPVDHAENNPGLAALTQSLAGVLKDTTPLHAAPAKMPPPVDIQAPLAPTGGLIVNLIVAHTYKVNEPATLEELRVQRDPATFLKMYRSIAPPLLDEAAVTADGTLYMGAEMGQVRKRSPDGEWSHFGFDTLRQTLSVEMANGRLVTGSDDGHVPPAMKAQVGANCTPFRRGRA